MGAAKHACKLSCENELADQVPILVSSWFPNGMHKWRHHVSVHWHPFWFKMQINTTRLSLHSQLFVFHISLVPSHLILKRALILRCQCSNLDQQFWSAAQLEPTLHGKHDTVPWHRGMHLWCTGKKLKHVHWPSREALATRSLLGLPISFHSSFQRVSAEHLSNIKTSSLNLLLCWQCCMDKKSMVHHPDMVNADGDDAEHAIDHSRVIQDDMIEQMDVDNGKTLCSCCSEFKMWDAEKAWWQQHFDFLNILLKTSAFSTFACISQRIVNVAAHRKMCVLAKHACICATILPSRADNGGSEPWSEGFSLIWLFSEHDGQHRN